MKNTDSANRLLITAAAAAVLLTAALPFLAVLLKERAVLRYEAAFIARIHEEIPDREADVARLLYTTKPSREGVLSGQEVLQSLAYTDQAFPVLRERLRDPEILFGSLLLGLLLSGLLILIALELRKRIRKTLQEKEHEMTLLRDRNSALQRLSSENQRLREFIENIAHQIKTPLSRALTSLDLLQEEVKAENDGPIARVQECISHIEGIGELVRRLLGIGRMEACEVLFEAEPFSLRALSEELLSDIPEEVRPEMLLEPDNGAFIYQGSPTWIREALNNLLVNAQVHGRSGTSPKLLLEDLPEEYRITLRDYGPGISDEDLPQLFDRFYRTKTMKKGHVGLGLNLVRLIVEGHKGRITAENPEDGGARFTVLLPKYVLLK